MQQSDRIVATLVLITALAASPTPPGQPHHRSHAVTTPQRRAPALRHRGHPHPRRTGFAAHRGSLPFHRPATPTGLPDPVLSLPCRLVAGGARTVSLEWRHGDQPGSHWTIRNCPTPVASAGRCRCPGGMGRDPHGLPPGPPRRLWAVHRDHDPELDPRAAAGTLRDPPAARSAAAGVQPSLHTRRPGRRQLLLLYGQRLSPRTRYHVHLASVTASDIQR